MILNLCMLAVLLALINLPTALGSGLRKRSVKEGSTLVPPHKNEAFPAPTYCEMDDGSQGHCVQSYLCENQQINDDGSGLITERKYQCLAPKVCCKLGTETITQAPGNEKRNDRAIDETTAKGSTLVPNVGVTGPKRNRCEFKDGRKGYCVQSYLCKNKKINDDGSDLISERTYQCMSPEICCELDHEPITETEKPRTLVPPLKERKPGEPCSAYDGSQGRCVLVHLCNNDTTIVDGSGLISERGADPCVAWQGGIQICCPAKFLTGKIIPGETEITTEQITRNRYDKDDVCLTSDQSEGKCVPPYQCDDFDGSGLINARTSHFRYQGSCPDKTFCCKKEKVDETRTLPTPFANKPCGVSYKDGLWPCTASTNCPKVGAFEAKFGEFPWMVAVRTRTARFPENYNNTGGSLIHPSVVLTVAHYVARAVDDDVRVRAGEWNVLDVNEPLPHQEVAVKNTFIHPDFNKKNYRNDIALLFLESPIRLLPHIGVVCLPAAGEVVAPSTDCISNGWGKDKFGNKGVVSDVLKKLILPAVDHQDCQSRLQTTRLGPFFNLHEGFTCAGGESLDTCSLDGGSPLTCPMEADATRYVQHGVVAWGVDCHLPGIPGVYMNVAHYRTWIDQQVNLAGLETSVYTV
ncbi:hypothetical protein ABMA28_013017 [Loxostege sticticalis]|uniref:Peptidase S1 domain-containing protein n=1 Tax=Loxostege sticticalis TaxID=481309 RepID=A0ABD0S3A5_LOXSC